LNCSRRQYLPPRLSLPVGALPKLGHPRHRREARRRLGLNARSCSISSSYGSSNSSSSCRLSLVAKIGPGRLRGGDLARAQETVVEVQPAAVVAIVAARLGLAVVGDGASRRRVGGLVAPPTLSRGRRALPLLLLLARPVGVFLGPRTSTRTSTRASAMTSTLCSQSSRTSVLLLTRGVRPWSSGSPPLARLCSLAPRLEEPLLQAV
jgi:hypothetical protein